MLSATDRSYCARISARNSAWRRSSSRMSARVWGAFSHVMQSEQRSSTITTSALLASQRSGCRNCDPQLGQRVSTATPREATGHPGQKFIVTPVSSGRLPCSGAHEHRTDQHWTMVSLRYVRKRAYRPAMTPPRDMEDDGARRINAPAPLAGTDAARFLSHLTGM